MILIQRARSGIVGHINIRPAIIIKIRRQHAQSIRSVGRQYPRRFRNILERSVAIVVVQNIFPAIQSRRPARHQQPLVIARPRLRHRRGRQIEIDIIRHEKIQPPVAIVIHERAPTVPPLARSRHARFFAHIRKSSIAIIVIQQIFPEICHEQIVKSVVVVIPDAHALPPAGMHQPGFHRHIRKRPVAIILEQVRGRLLPLRKSFQPPAIHEKNIQPPVVVVVVKRHAASGRFQQIFVLVLAAKNRLGVQPSFFRNVQKTQPQRRPRNLRICSSARSRSSWRYALRKACTATPRQLKNAFQR